MGIIFFKINFEYIRIILLFIYFIIFFKYMLNKCQKYDDMVSKNRLYTLSTQHN